MRRAAGRTFATAGVSAGGSRDAPPRPLLLAAVAAVALLAFVPAALAQDEGHGYGGRVVSHEGWYTDEQADRGEEAYARHCARCHLVGMDGVIGFSPPLIGPEFLARWEGATVQRLFHWTRMMMPQDDPASLADETYLDILAHLLRANGLPPGEVELRPSAGQLGRLALPDADDRQVERAPE